MKDLIAQIFKELFSPERHKVFIGFVVIGAFALLILPEPVAKFFRLQAFISTYDQWIGLTALLGSVLVIIEVGVWWWSKWKANRRKEQEQQKREAELCNLSLEEKSVLRPFIENKTKSYLLDEDSIAILLEEKDILYRLDTGYLTGYRQRLIPRQKNYYISDWAYKYLVKNPHLIL